MKQTLLILVITLSLLATASRGGEAAKDHRSYASVSAAGLGYMSIASKDGHILIYPNPATDLIYIKGDAQSAYVIEIMNLLGAVVRNEEIENGSVSVADLQPGMYIVRIYGRDGQLYLSSKLTKQ